MPTRRGPKNNVLAGVFLIASLALALTIFFILSSAWERLTVPTTRYIVRFTLGEGAEGLDTGAPVKIGGERVGRVVRWRFHNTPDGRPEGVNVEIEVRSNIKLYEDAVPMLMLPLLGSNSSINFPDVGDGTKVVSPQHGDPLLTSLEELDGHRAPPAFLAQAGYGPQQAMQVQKIISDAAETTDRLSKITQKVETELDPTFEQIRKFTGTANNLTIDATASWKEWKELVGSALKQLEEGSKKLSAMIDDGRAGVSEAREVISGAQTMLDENRPKVSAAVDDVAQLTRKLNTDTYGALMETLQKGDKSVGEFVEALDRVNALIGRRAPDLETTLANARLASDQLKLTLTEVRQAPWKLLNKPTGRKDLENEVLYDSVRAYATAVADLRAAAASLESMSVGAGAGTPSEIDRRTIQEITADLKTAFERYQKAEKDFLARWAEAK
jgi:ABC-type transporter Mla subunit MlaD